eukprot:6175309-Pleurochrysis_carterae.AAC.2
MGEGSVVGINVLAGRMRSCAWCAESDAKSTGANASLSAGADAETAVTGARGAAAGATDPCTACAAATGACTQASAQSSS